MATKGKSARQKGHSYELAIAKEHAEIGFTDVFTSRSESKRLDDKGVDLTGLPYWVQCKAVERLAPSIHEILAGMPDDKVRAVFHKRNRKGTIVALPKEDWYDMLRFLVKKGYFKNK